MKKEARTTQPNQPQDHKSDGRPKAARLVVINTDVATGTSVWQPHIRMLDDQPILEAIVASQANTVHRRTQRRHWNRMLNLACIALISLAVCACENTAEGVGDDIEDAADEVEDAVD